MRIYKSNILYTFKRHEGVPKLEASTIADLIANNDRSDPFGLKKQVQARFMVGCQKSG